MLLVVLACLVIATAASADVILFSFAGFDWFWPTGIGQVGSCYSAVGYVNSFDSTYVNADFSTNEYTFIIDLACFVSADSSFFPFVQYIYDGSTSSMRVYCDPIATGTHGDYGTNPPNAVSPSTFIDGDCILSGTWNGDLAILLDTSTGNGDISGELMWNGGSQLGNIPVNQRNMSLAVGGVKFNPPGGPLGYHWQIDGTVFIQSPVPVEETSWGALKRDLGGY